MANKIKECPLCKKYGPSEFCRVCQGKGFVQETNRGDKRKRKNEESRNRAKRQGKKFSDHDIEMLKNPEYSIQDLSKKLSRSIKSIETARYRLRKFGDLNG